MNPIVNPWWFYLSERVDAILILSILGLLASGTMVLYSVLDEHKNERYNKPDKLDEDYVEAKKNRKLFTKILIPCLIIAIFTPSSSTVCKMIVAQNITPNNIAVVGGKVEDVVDYICEKIEELDKAEE